MSTLTSNKSMSRIDNYSCLFSAIEVGDLVDVTKAPFLMECNLIYLTGVKRNELSIKGFNPIVMIDLYYTPIDKSTDNRTVQLSEDSVAILLKQKRWVVYKQDKR